jgi:hypothetical protein
MSTLATFAVIVSDGKAFNLGMLFLGATILEPTQRDEYKEVLQQYAPVPLDYTELPLAQAA